MTLGPGIYRIYNAYTPIVMDLSGAKSDDSTPIFAWADHGGYNQAWLVETVPGQTDTYTIRNLAGGSYMDLSGGSSKDGTPIIGFHYHGGDNQKWIIKKPDNNWWKIQNVQTKTFLDLYYGYSTNGTKITGWQGSWGTTSSGHQSWGFTKISHTSSEIHTLLRNNASLAQDFQSYLSDGLYLLLPEQKLRDIWNGSGLKKGSLVWRKQIFDCDDFAVVFKAEVAKWGANNLKANGFAVLCGLMFGRNNNGAHAFNWTIEPSNTAQIVFIEPQGINFSTTPFGYSGYFGLF